MACIELQNVSKTFYVGALPGKPSLPSLLAKLSGREMRSPLEALQNISLKINKGELFGIIGANGAGKSTLLSVIANIYRSTSGTVRTEGKIIPVIGLAHGLRDRLTMKDNIFLCCALFGLTRKQIIARFGSIVDLTGLAQFLNTKTYHFSDGMRARLVFAMAIHCGPDILLFDEITSNLDKEFVALVLQTLRQKTQNGVTSLIVSHHQHVIEHCHNAAWLEKGQLKKIGPTAQIAPEYFSS